MLFLVACAIAIVHVTSVNLRPIVGVMAQPSKDVPEGKTSYVAASYVKFVEGSGARVVPVRFDAPLTELEELIGGLNGLIFPGGSASLASDSAYYKALSFMFYKGLQLNIAGTHFPMWGTCLGFEFLHIVAANEDHTVLSRCACVCVCMRVLCVSFVCA